MGLISQQLKKQLHRYHTSTERLITELTKENEQLKEEIRLLQMRDKLC